jgi:anti-sigma factor RsiW
MNCSEVNELMSAYFDDQLSSGTRGEVTAHVKSCPGCAHQLEAFSRLSALTAGLTYPEPPESLWAQIADRLTCDGVAVRCDRALFHGVRKWSRRPVVRLGLTAAAVVVLMIAWAGFRELNQRRLDRQFATEFGQYLEAFDRDPRAAQQLLVARYDGLAVDAQQAAQTVGYRPAIADGLPAGYSVESTHVMQMPCCTCVQCLCHRRDGTAFAIFEHGEQSGWFGGRRESEAICNGTRCGMVELDGRIAATWKLGNRHITIIGARDKAEVEQLVAWLDNKKRTPSR